MSGESHQARARVTANDEPRPKETVVDFRGIDTFDPEATAVTFARFRVVANRPGIETLPL